MPEKLTECSFLIPVYPDGVPDPVSHSPAKWDWLVFALWDRFGAATRAPGVYSGFYADLDTGERIHDESRKFLIAISRDELDKLRGLLTEACEVFEQKCIYLNVGGDVEFVYRLNLLN